MRKLMIMFILALTFTGCSKDVQLTPCLGGVFEEVLSSFYNYTMRVRYSDIKPTYESTYVDEVNITDTRILELSAKLEEALGVHIVEYSVRKYSGGDGYVIFFLSDSKYRADMYILVEDDIFKWYLSVYDSEDNVVLSEELETTTPLQ